jgi:uncharacterized protein (DUF1800 family)
MKATRLLLVTAFASLSLAACGGSSSGSTSPPPPPPPPPPATVSMTEAFQFLNQATFGATEDETQRVVAIGIETWIDEQLQMQASLQLPHLLSLPTPQFAGELQADRVDIWFRNAINGQDQLRQRVAFALSEIMVVSQLGALIDAPYALGDYYDTLARGAFGNYRDLIENVTLHPAMGVYLSMLGNERPNPVLNIRPDENYARELMQLFSIGLVELNADGTQRLNAQQQPVPTYDQSVINGFAHVYTGWHYAGAPSFEQAPQLVRSLTSQITPMELYPPFHDDGAKKLLNGVTLAPGQPGETDLADALDNVFNHANVGPFVSVRLIQRLVTSNPSPGYVQRVAAVFDNNGFGVRGDLGAVVKAILMDDEARPALPMEIDGKVKEPLLRLTQLWRAYDATSASGVFPLAASYIIFGQGPLQSPSVFNFFSPFFAPAGEIRDSSFVAPELEIATEYQNTFVTNYFFLASFGLNSANPDLEQDDVFIDISAEMTIAGDTNALIDMVSGKLMAGNISTTLRSEMERMINIIDVADTANRTAEAIFLVVSSPEFSYQR